MSVDRPPLREAAMSIAKRLVDEVEVTLSAWEKSDLIVAIASRIAVDAERVKAQREAEEAA